MHSFYSAKQCMAPRTGRRAGNRRRYDVR